MTKNLTRSLADTVQDHLAMSLNETYRDECFKILDVKNSTEAGKKFEELAEHFKGNVKRKAVEENSEKINENSP